ncbi:MBOAT family O-acyltransferase [Tropicibacter alexandrii]|uniref:MBOAT family O-acyltransferase n=1 Tax=Tropicibacter alexandrii TaxID=2267683 RepID=UPI000EF4D763|nr:MBOAT family O-acyltransferase [Tropicibacter alexandrii]
MLFNSWEYILFLAVVVGIYFTAPFRWRVPFLLVASYFFYMQWSWKLAFLIGFVTLFNFEAGRRIAQTEDRFTRRAWLWFACVVSLGILGFFKYFNFFNDSFRTIFEMANMTYMVPHLDIILPVGISFFTFQALSYPIDVYRGAHGPERSVMRFSTYVVFFPQLIAGPIERATTLLDQFSTHHRFDTQRFAEGARLIIWGLFKKIVIADRLALYVDDIYAHPELHDGSTLLLATYFFTFQIYCDFSAYSDIAIGSARMLGYDLMKNFNLPYFARTITDFWRRWHISLTSWFTSYVYIPLGGSRTSLPKWIRNVWIVFLLSGLWHGAAWTFVVWGGLHAAYYMVQRGWHAILPVPDRPSLLRSAFGLLVTFHAVVLAWVFFRAASIEDAWIVVTRILTDLGGMPDLGSSRFSTMVNVLLIFFLLAVQTGQVRGWFSFYFSESRVPRPLQISGHALLLCGIALLGASSSAFIYFQF